MASREIGSVYIKVQPDADGFRRSAQRQIDQQGPIEADAEVDIDNSQMMREKKRAEAAANRRPLKIGGEVDWSSAKESLAEMAKHSQRQAQSMRDMRAEVDRIHQVMEQMQRHLGDMELGVDEESFRRVQERVEQLESELELSTAGAEATVERFRQQVEAQSAEIDLEANPDMTSVAAASTAMRAATPTIPVRTRIDRTSLASTLTGIRALTNADAILNLRPQLRGMARIEAALLRLSRDRVIRMRTELTGRTWRVLRGGLRSMAGLGDMDEMIHTFETITQRLDVLGTQAATMGTAIGSAVNVATHALGGLVVTLADVSRSLGLIAAAPTAILAGWAGLHVHRTIWGGFRDALDGYADALEALPPNAQRAVKAIEALSKQVNDSVQDGFWSEMTDEISRFADTVAPVLEQGMHRTAEVYASGLKGMLDLAQSWAESGQLGAAFTNINRMFEGVADGAIEAFDAFMTVGMRASRMFPRLGHSVEQAMSGLNQWTQWASETGRIDRWIVQGVDTMRQLAQAGGAVVGMAQGLTQAFRNAGIEGLPAFVRGLEGARDVMQSSEWQFRMGNIFEGMAEGARLTWEGVREVASALYEAHQWAKELSITIGEVSLSGLERVADVLSNETFQRGSIDLFKGVGDSLSQLEPAADSLGTILGELGTLSGAIIREMAPGINTLMGIFSDAATQLTPKLVELVGPMTEFIDNLGHTMRWNVNNIIVPALSGLLDIFNALPAPMQRFIALGAVMSRWMPAFGQHVRSAGQRMRDAFQGHAPAMRAAQVQMQSFSRSAIGAVPALDRLSTSISRYQRQAGVSAQSFRIWGDSAERAGARVSNLAGNLSRQERYARAAATANRNFATSMGAMRTNLSGLGGALTASLGRFRQWSQGVSTSMRSVQTTLQRASNIMSGQVMARSAPGGLGAYLGINPRAIAQQVSQIERPMRQAINNVASHARTTFSGMFATIGPAAAAAGSNIRASMVPALNAAATAGRALRSVFTGMFALMGGVPGLALIGIITAIGTLRRSAAEAEQRVEGLFQALQSGSDIEFRNEVWNLLEDDLVSLTKAGADTSAMLDDLANGGDASAWADHAEALGTWADTVQNIGYEAAKSALDMDTINEAADAFGVTLSQAAGIGMDEWQGMARAINGVGDEIEASQIKQEAFNKSQGLTEDGIARTAAEAKGLALAMETNGEQFHAASAEAQQFAQALMTLGDGTQSADARISAMGEAIKLMSEDYSSSADVVVESWNRSEQAMRTMSDMAQSTGSIIADENGKLSTSYDDMSERQVLALQATQEAHESAMGQAIQAYDEIIDQGGSAAEAAEAGAEAYSGAMSSMSGSMEKFMRDADFTEEQIQAVIGEMEHLESVSDIEATLQMSNLSETEMQYAYDGLVRIREAGVEIDQAEWMAFIAANPDQALLAVSNTEMALLNFEAHEYIANLSADEQTALEAIATATGEGEAWASGEYAAVLEAVANMDDAEMAAEYLYQWDQSEGTALFSSRDEASEMIDTLMGKAGDFEGEHTATFLESGIGSIVESLDELVELVRQVAEEEYDIRISHNFEDVQADFEEMLGIGEQLSDPSENILDIQVQATDNATPTIDSVRQEALDLTNRRYVSELDANDNASGKAREAKSNIEWIPSRRNTILDAIDGTSGKARTAKSNIDWIPGQKMTDLFAQDRLSGSARDAGSAVGSIPAQKISEILGRGDLNQKAQDAKRDVDGIPGSKSSSLNYSGDLINMTRDAIATMDRLPSTKQVSLLGKDQISPMARQAQSAVEAIRSKKITIMASGNVTPFANQGTRAIDMVRDKKVALMANGNVTPFANQATRAISMVQSKTITLSAINRVSGVVNSVIGSLRRIPRMTTTTIRTVRQTVSKNDNGGLYTGTPRGMVQQFANGGFKENHTAQIAKPTTNYRVWAEPETGGEAYIPLAVSKRARSTEIWKETGRRLGVFEDGGIVDATTSRSSGGGVNVNVNVHNPLNERTSTSVQRELERISSGGIDA